MIRIKNKENLGFFSLLLLIGFHAKAEWSGEANSHMFYTDDVALFSVSQRLSLKDDPTQPMVDRPGQGGDFVYEPGFDLHWITLNHFGEFQVNASAAAYVFFERTQFNHGLFEIQAVQEFKTGTKLAFAYNVIPDLFLGQNEFMLRNGGLIEQDEALANHFWTLHLDQTVNDKLTLRLLSRYGIRRYDAPFQHRDTNFWTLGPHIEWEILPNVELLTGYHYERGSASQHKASHFPDDVSYVNHYASAELKVNFAPKWTAMLIFDFEKNDFTTRTRIDDHYGAAESVYQGELELLYELTEKAVLTMGWQHGQRRLNTEDITIRNNNIWVGIDYML
jgi:hypothetical protein